jgi:hypothetical protein
MEAAENIKERIVEGAEDVRQYVKLKVDSAKASARSVGEKVA